MGDTSAEHLAPEGSRRRAAEALGVVASYLGLGREPGWPVLPLAVVLVQVALASVIIVLVGAFVATLLAIAAAIVVVDLAWWAVAAARRRQER